MVAKTPQSYLHQCHSTQNLAQLPCHHLCRGMQHKIHDAKTMTT